MLVPDLLLSFDGFSGRVRVGGTESPPQTCSGGAAALVRVRGGS